VSRPTLGPTHPMCSGGYFARSKGPGIELSYRSNDLVRVNSQSVGYMLDLRDIYRWSDKLS